MTKRTLIGGQMEAEDVAPAFARPTVDIERGDGHPMANNVRCAGGGWWVITATEAVQRGEPARPYGTSQPCGWEGERFATGHVTRREADTLPIAELQARVLANQNTLRTAKPCPRCGGRVELIPTDGAA